MKTRLARFACLLLLLAASAAAVAQPVAGREYLPLDPPQPVSAREPVEVIEFFSYGCPVCYAAEPYLTRWLMKRGAEVEFRRIPSTLPPAWAPFARIYFALEATGLLERLHWPVFDNHHFDGRRLSNEKNLLDWLSANGVDAARFSEVMKSDAVDAKMSKARAMLDTYGIQGVPTFVVDGRYVTSARLAGGVEEAVEVVDHLVDRVRAERGAPK